MKNSINLYFNLEIKENELAFSMIKHSLMQLKQLEDAGIQIEYLQLRAKELSGLSADKEIWLKIDSDRGTYMASNISLEWNQAFINTLQTVKEKMLYEEADYTKFAALVEVTSPSSEYSRVMAV